jgi:hypothetical protein
MPHDGSRDESSGGFLAAVVNVGFIGDVFDTKFNLPMLAKRFT